MNFLKPQSFTTSQKLYKQHKLCMESCGELPRISTSTAPRHFKIMKKRCKAVSSSKRWNVSLALIPAYIKQACQNKWGVLSRVHCIYLPPKQNTDFYKNRNKVISLLTKPKYIKFQDASKCIVLKYCFKLWLQWDYCNSKMLP